jgi:hypothetical protein
VDQPTPPTSTSSALRTISLANRDVIELMAPDHGQGSSAGEAAHCWRAGAGAG